MVPNPWRVSACAMACASALVSWQLHAQQVADFPRATPGEAGLDARVLEGVDSSARASLPALQAMVVLRKGRLAWERYWGGADSNTVFNAKSVSKSFLSALVGIAVGQGRLSLDQRVSSLLPRYFDQDLEPANRMFRAAVVRNDSVRATITVRQLLTMTTGYAWDEGGPILSTFLVSGDPVRLVAELPLAAMPGASFNYTTGGTHLLAAALAQAVGVPLRTFANEMLFGPAGITLREWDVDGAGNPLGGSEMYFTPRGLARFGQLYLDRGNAGTRSVVPADWVASSWERHTAVESPLYTGMIPGLTGYGYLWWLRKSGERTMNCALGFGGQFVLVVPELDLVIAGASALDSRNPGNVPQFNGIFRLVDAIVGSVSRKP